MPRWGTLNDENSLSVGHCMSVSLRVSHPAAAGCAVAMTVIARAIAQSNPFLITVVRRLLRKKRSQ